MSNPTDEDVAEVLRILEEQKALEALKAKQRLIISAEFGPLQEKCRILLAPMKPADNKTRAKKDFLSTGFETVGADELPRPHLIYFLLEELLGYQDLGQFEKLAWSIPVDLDGHAYLIEHRIADYLTRLDFVILDERGYLPFPQAGGQLLLHSVSRLYEQNLNRRHHQSRLRRVAQRLR
jgi:hypothetical protein